MKAHLQKFYVIMKRHPQSFVLCLSLFCFLLRLWLSVDGNTTTRQAPIPTPQFSSLYVKDVYSGSLVERNVYLNQGEVSLVFYYAPWCSKSAKGLTQFLSVAQQYHDQVKFIAVDCWWDKGECRGSNEIHYFPQVFLHHKLAKLAVHYNGPITVQYLSNFLQKALSSAYYLGSVDDVNHFTMRSQVSVIGYFPLPSSTHVLAKFLELSLASLQYYPGQVVSFGIITSYALSRELSIGKGYARKYDRLYGELKSVGTINFNNFTLDSALGVVKDHAVAVSNILVATQKSNSLFINLKDGPTLLAFVTNLKQIQSMEEIAVKYYQHCYDRKVCRAVKVNTDVCNICAVSDHQEVPPSIAEHLITSFLHKQVHLLPFLHNHCFVTIPLYDTQRTHIESCCFPMLNPTDNFTSISGLACKTNRTIGFVVLNRDEFPAIADNVGLKTNESVSIVDLEKEEALKMVSEFNSANLEKYILDFTNNKLMPTFQPLSTTKEKSIQDEERIEIPSVEAANFNRRILNSSKDILLLYQTPWCGFCSGYVQTLLTFKMHFAHLKNIEILQINEENVNQLSVSFRPILFPSLFLYPGNRTYDSVFFSTSTQMTLPNLVDFVLRHASPNTKAELVLMDCDQTNFAESKHFSPCKLNELKERLINHLSTIQNWKKHKGNFFKLLNSGQSKMTSLKRAMQPHEVSEKMIELSKRQSKLRENMLKIEETIDQLARIHTSVRHEVTKFTVRDEL